MQEFAAEQHLPRANATAAPDDASAARAAAEQLSREGTTVEFLRSIFIPEDETCIYLYRADSIEAVRTAAARTPLRFERISEGVVQTGMPKRRPQ